MRLEKGIWFRAVHHYNHYLQRLIRDSLTCQYPPQVVLLAVDLYEDFIDVEGVGVSTMLPLKSAGVKSSELDAP